MGAPISGHCACRGAASVWGAMTADTEGVAEIETELFMPRRPGRGLGERRVNLAVALAVLAATVLGAALGGIWIGYRFFWKPPEVISRLDVEIQHWRQVVEQDPGNFEALYKLGWSYYQKADIAQALTYTEAAVGLQPDHAGSLFNLGLMYSDLQLHDQALVQFKLLADRYPRHELAWLALGRTYLELGRSDDALKALLHTIEINPASADIRFALGTAYERRSDSERALAEYREAIRYDPKHAPATTALRRMGVTEP